MSLVDDLHAAGLTGRGGAAFSTGVKVRAAHDHGAHLVVNACDGEIGAAKDAYVVEHHLDELLRGASLVADGRRRRWPSRPTGARAPRPCSRPPVPTSSPSPDATSPRRSPPSSRSPTVASPAR